MTTLKNWQIREHAFVVRPYAGDDGMRDPAALHVEGMTATVPSSEVSGCIVGRCTGKKWISKRP